MRSFSLDNQPVRVNIFESYPEFVRGALGSSEMPDRERSSRQAKGTNGANWYGGTWDYAAKTAPFGDIEGAGRLRAGILREANRIMGIAERMDPLYREEGGIWIDVSRFLSGEPECWGDLVYQGETRRARQAAIVFNAGANCHISPKDYERAASLLGGAILGLRSSGVSVSLHLCYANSGNGETDITAVCLTPGGGFDVAKLSATCQTWFFRRIVFSYWECREASFRKGHDIKLGWGYGRSASMNQAQAVAVSGFKKSLLFNLEQMVHLSDDQIKAQILKAIEPEREAVK